MAKIIISDSAKLYKLRKNSSLNSALINKTEKYMAGDPIDKAILSVVDKDKTAVKKTARKISDGRIKVVQLQSK